MAASCSCAKYFLLFFNLIIWLSGGAFLSFGILLILKREFFALLSYDVHIVPSFHHMGCVFIGLGVLVFILGLTGCCGSVRESRLLLGLYVFLIILVMGTQLFVAMYTLVYSNQWSNRLASKLKQRVLNYNYTKPEQFEYDLDIIHKQFNCCGIDGATDFYEKKNSKASDRQLPLSCCNDSFNDVCLENYSHKQGCYQKIDEYIRLYSKLIISIGIGIALFELTALILAVSLCVQYERQKWL